METFAPTSAYRHKRIRIATARPTEFIDLTDEVRAFVEASKVQTGLVNIQGLHTTTAVIVNEHDPLLLSVTAHVELPDGSAPSYMLFSRSSRSATSLPAIKRQPPGPS